MTAHRRWMVQDRYGNDIYLTQERWEHIVDPLNHPEMAEYEEELQRTVSTGKRKQDPLAPQKFRYSMEFVGLAEDNTHVVAIVLFGFSRDAAGNPIPNNYLVTAYQKEIG
ncbi:MAG TPA: hypothetical protein PKO09_01880 [Anaerolineae bacterium]|nr:hypothetical protein [Anaerolineae bacterium]